MARITRKLCICLRGISSQILIAVFGNICIFLGCIFNIVETIQFYTVCTLSRILNIENTSKNIRSIGANSRILSQYVSFPPI